jgi:hypothetical protein
MGGRTQRKGLEMKINLFFGAVLAVTIASAPVGCKKDEASCDAVFDHIRSLTPEPMREMLDENKQAALKQCETLSGDERKCALAAKTIEELQACKK